MIMDRQVGNSADQDCIILAQKLGKLKQSLEKVNSFTVENWQGNSSKVFLEQLTIITSLMECSRLQIQDLSAKIVGNIPVQTETLPTI